MITRSPSLRNRNFMESLFESVGQGRVRPQEHTNDHQRNFNQCREVFLKTNITFAHLLTDQTTQSLTQEWKLSTTVENVRGWFISWLFNFTRVHIVWWLHVTIKKLQTLIPCGVHFVIVFETKVPKTDRRAAWSTDRDSTRTAATNTRTAVGIGPNLHHNSQHNDVP